MGRSGRHSSFDCPAQFRLGGRGRADRDALQRLGDHGFRLDRRAEDLGNGLGHDEVPSGLRALGRHRCRRSDAEQIVVESLSDSSHQHRHVCALASSVGVEFVQNEEPHARGVTPKRYVHGVEARHEEFKHHVVGQEDVGRVLHDAIPVLAGFLTRVAGERDRLLAFGVAILQEPLEFLVLAVAKGVHRIDDDGRDPLEFGVGLPAAEHVVDDRDEIGERLA